MARDSRNLVLTHQYRITYPGWHTNSHAPSGIASSSRLSVFDSRVPVASTPIAPSVVARPASLTSRRNALRRARRSLTCHKRLWDLALQPAPIPARKDSESHPLRTPALRVARAAVPGQTCACAYAYLCGLREYLPTAAAGFALSLRPRSPPPESSVSSDHSQMRSASGETRRKPLPAREYFHGQCRPAVHQRHVAPMPRRG